MLGAIAGDILGSCYEFNPTKEYNFELLCKEARPTDDTVMTLAVAEWLVEDCEHTQEGLSQYMRQWGRTFPNVGYGASFGGLSALLSMLNSCASGVSVVNIDNGFGAGYLASMINHLD